MIDNIQKFCPPVQTYKTSIMMWVGGLEGEWVDDL